MTRKFICLLPTAIGLMAAQSAHANPGLRCVIDAPHRWLGQAVTWHLRRDGAGSPLPEIMPSQLAPDWHIAYQSESRWTDAQGRARESAEITLYPMRAGILALPAVRAGGTICPPRDLTIAAHAPGQPGMTVTTRLDPPHPYRGQAVFLTMDIAYAGDLTWDSVTPHSTNAELRPIHVAQGKQTGPLINVRHFAWTILPLKSGRLTVRFGRLTARHAGPIEIWPAPPSVQVNVRAVPAFMPADSLIGAPTATILAASHRLDIGGTGLLAVRLSGVGLTRPTVAAVFDPPPISPGLRFGPPLITRATSDDGALVDVWKIDLPFKAVRAGHLTYPRLRIDYFDPLDGVPRAIFLQPRSLRVGDPMRREIGIAVMVAAVILLSLVTGWFGVRAAWRLMLVARARARLRKASTAMQARDLLLSSPGVPPSATLRQWLNRTAPADPGMTAVIAQIEHELYGLGGSNRLSQTHAEALARQIGWIGAAQADTS